MLISNCLIISFCWMVTAPTEAGALSEERFQWRGQVDGVDEIMIRGESVRVRHLEKKPIQRQDHRFSAPLPSRDLHLELRKIKGRGDVRLVEEPSSWNDYTAIVRVDDGEQVGDDYYEFELLWRDDSWDDWENSDWDHSDEWEDGFDYRSEGVFRWQGRVDIGAEIQIRGDDYRVNDMGGSGTQERRARFGSPLPLSSVPVSLRKIDGRGKVELLQTPDSSNDYTAIVRIEDDKSGADDYEFELTWRRR
jgi:hypothetical protein